MRLFQPFLSGLNPQSEGRWVVADLHIHSIYSGGSLSVKEIFKLAQTQLIDVIGISDHHEVKGAMEGQAIYTADPKLPLNIVSREISAGDHFHLLIIGGNQNSWEGVNRSQLSERIQEHHKSGGITVMAHPWTMPKSSWAWGFLKELTVAELLDGVELFNSSLLEFTQAKDTLIRPFWEEWIVPYQLGVFGGSDFHYHRQGRYLGTGRTYLKVFLPGERGIMDALKNHRCVAGLFSHHFFDLGWIGSGNSIVFGMEPWCRELKKLIGELKNTLAESWYLKPSLTHYIAGLIEGGHFQLVKDILG